MDKFEYKILDPPTGLKCEMTELEEIIYEIGIDPKKVIPQQMFDTSLEQEMGKRRWLENVYITFESEPYKEIIDSENYTFMSIETEQSFNIFNKTILIALIIIILAHILILGPIFEHIINDTGKLVGSCRYGFGRTFLSLFSSKKRSCGRVASLKTVCRYPKYMGSTIGTFFSL